MSASRSTSPLIERITATVTGVFEDGQKAYKAIIMTFKEMVSIADELLGNDYSFVIYDHDNPFKDLKERSETKKDARPMSVRPFVRRVSWPGNDWAVMGILPGQQGRRFWAYWMQIRPFDQGIEVSFGGHEPIRLSFDAWDESKKAMTKETLKMMISKQLEGLIDMLKSSENIADYSLNYFQEAEGGGPLGDEQLRPNLVSIPMNSDSNDEVSGIIPNISPLRGTRLWSSVAIGLNSRLCD